MKKHAATLVLVVLAVSLGIWLWLDRDRVTEGERKRRDNNVFVAWRREELTQITIVHDGETIALERTAEGSGKDSKDGKEGKDAKEHAWRMTAPRAERADQVAVDRLLGTLEFATVTRKVADGSAHGLDAPRATGSLKMGGLVVKFALGATSPQPEGSSYFRVDSGAAVVVSKELADTMLESSDVYRDRTVVPYLATELAKFEVTRPDGGGGAGGAANGFTLERIDEIAFRLAPSGLLASRSAVDRLWASLAEMRAESFPKDADADQLTAHPVVTIKLTPKDATKPPAELVIGEACPGLPADVVVLRRAPTRALACAPKDIVTAMLADDATLVEKHPFTLRMDEIEELRLERTAGDAGTGAGAAAQTGAPNAIELARKGTGFHERAPVNRDVSAPEAAAATELLTRIASSEATTAMRGAGAFAAVGRAVARSGEHEQIVEIGAPHEGGGATLRRLLDDARLEVSATVLRRLIPRETTLRPRTMLETDPRRVTRVLLRCGTDQELVDSGEGFRLVKPAGYETDGAISQLVDAVMRGSVDAWVADADDGSFGFARDGCHAVFAFEDGNAPVTLWFGSEGEGGIYARLEPRSGVMVVPRSIRELAARIYVNRGMLRTDPSSIERVSVTFEGKQVPPRDPKAFRDAMGALYIDTVVALHQKPRGTPDLTIEIALSEGGPPRRVLCWSPHGPSPRDCTIDGVDATFAVAQAKLAPFLPSSSGSSGGGAGAGADAGPHAGPDGGH